MLAKIALLSCVTEIHVLQAYSDKNKCNCTLI